VSKTSRKHSAGKKNSEKVAGKNSKKDRKKSANKKKSKKNSAKKSKKNRKRKSKKSSRKQTKKPSKKKPVKSCSKARQSNTTCGVADVVAAIKKFTAYTTNLNQNKRIKSFVSQTQSKAVKALTGFQAALSLLALMCNKYNVTVNSTVSTTYSTLQNCSKSAASLCNVELSPADNTTVNSCFTSLNAFIASFQVHTALQGV